MKSVILLFSVALLFWSCKDPTETTSSRGCEAVSGTRTARAAEDASAQPADPILVSTNVPEYKADYLSNEGLYDPHNKCAIETLEAVTGQAYKFRDPKTGLVYDEDKKFMKEQHVYLILEHNSDNYVLDTVKEETSDGKSYQLFKTYRSGNFHYYPMFYQGTRTKVELKLFSKNSLKEDKSLDAWELLADTTVKSTDNPATIQFTQASGMNVRVKLTEKNGKVAEEAPAHV